jgi:drug/metabolite transporter (DMT)-like permease
MRWTVWVAFLALCILAGSSWVIPEMMGDGLPTLERQGVLFAVIGLCGLAFAIRRVGLSGTGKLHVQVALAGLGVFGFSDVAVEYARGSVSSFSRSALYAMVPVVVVMAVAAGVAGGSEERGAEEHGARRLLVPALAGLGGLLLILPLQFSGTARGWVMVAFVCLAVVLAGLASVWMYRLLRGYDPAVAMAVTGLANAMCLLIWSGVREDMVWRWNGLASVVSISSLVDVVEVLLILWLLGKMLPVRFAARYLAIPLLTVLEGLVFERPKLTVRIVCGVALLAAGTGMLLFLKAGEEDTVLSLR